MRDDIEMQGAHDRAIDRKPWHCPELVECVVPDMTGNGGGPNSDGANSTTSGSPN